ncbi:MAG: hypothetical protein Q3962_00770 [Corynebacterium sp.]|nr:hypothetical protein [Corynebacterium sp.]
MAAGVLLLGSTQTAWADDPAPTGTGAGTSTGDGASAQEESGTKDQPTQTDSAPDEYLDIPTYKEGKLGSSESAWNAFLYIGGSSANELGDTWMQKLVEFIFSIPPLTLFGGPLITDYRARALLGPFIPKEKLESYCPEWRTMGDDEMLVSGQEVVPRTVDFCNRGIVSTWAERWNFLVGTLTSSSPMNGDSIYPEYIIKKSKAQLEWEAGQRQKTIDKWKELQKQNNNNE